MGNTPSRYPRSIKTAGGQRVPQKFIDEVLNHLADDMTALRSCSLVAKSWINLSRRHLFNSVFFTANDIAKWNETFPNPGEGPARHVRDLSFCFIQPDATIVFADRMSYFFNVQKLTLIGQVATRPDFISALGQLPPSTRSVDITFSKFLTAHVISVMKQLPNLDSLSLMSMELDGPIPAGAGNLIRGRLRGKLRLRRRFVNHDLLNTLAEVPTRPQFTEVEIRDARMDCFPATINLVGACQDTLTKLHFSALVQGEHSADQSFDFSHCTRIREVDLGAIYTSGILYWITRALSTLNPGNSPLLSTVTLRLSTTLSLAAPGVVLDEGVGDELSRIGREVLRIKNAYATKVVVTVRHDLAFRAVLDLQPIWRDLIEEDL